MKPQPAGDPGPLRAGRPRLRRRGWGRSFLAFLGPGYLVAVGYMDPGNWATGIAAGSAFGYQLLFVVVVSNLAAMVFQALAVRLGLATGMDLAQACRAGYGRRTGLVLWLLCELAIVACDLAELVGAAIALKLLFGLPLLAGTLLTTLQVLLVLRWQNGRRNVLEIFVVGLLATVGLCIGLDLVLARPDMSAVIDGLWPAAQVLRDPEMIYLAAGILGATLMPHNLYLHSALVKERRGGTPMRAAIRYATADVVIALGLAVFVNGAILVLAAATFQGSEGVGSAESVGLEDAYRLLAPLLGGGVASTLFAVALLAAGQSSSLTATLAGQVVMEGFTRFRWPAWTRRLVSRLVALVPAVTALAAWGEEAETQLLIVSQVVLSLQLPFALYPLVRFTSSRSLMGRHVSPPSLVVVASLLTAAIVALNLWLLLAL